jgi:hypothetical protein
MATSKDLFERQAKLLREYGELVKASQDKLASIAEVQQDLDEVLSQEKTKLQEDYELRSK